MDVDDSRVFDAGDLIIQGSVEENLHRLQLVFDEIVHSGRTPIVLGGEHTISYGCVNALNDVAVLSFDAHLDMRDEYLGLKLSHATFMRRLIESKGSTNFMELGIRAVCNEELDFVEKENVEYVNRFGYNDYYCITNNKEINDFLSGFHKVYLTIDMDVLDPSYAPAVGNPVPEGLSPTILLDLLKHICEKT